MRRLGYGHNSMDTRDRMDFIFWFWLLIQKVGVAAYLQHLQLVALLTRRELSELSLWDTSSESLESAENLRNTLSIELLSVWLLNKSLDLGQRGADQVGAHRLVDLVEDGVQERWVALLEVKHLVDVAGLDQVVNANALGHDKGLVGLWQTETVDEAHGGTALGDQTDGGERGEEEGVWDGVDEVGEAGEGGGETDGWAVERSDEDLWVGVEGLGDVQVLGDEAGQEVTVDVSALCDVTAEGNISSAVHFVS